MNTKTLDRVYKDADKVPEHIKLMAAEELEKLEKAANLSELGNVEKMKGETGEMGKWGNCLFLLPHFPYFPFLFLRSGVIFNLYVIIWLFQV